MHLERLTAVLEAIAVAGKPLSATELHEMTSLPVPTCYRLLHMLEEQRLLEDPENNNRYVIGNRLMRIALLGRTDTDVCKASAPLLKEATAEFGESVFLSRFRQRGVSIIHVETPQDTDTSYVHPGLGFRPLHACSCGKAIAAFADDAFREHILKRNMKAYTDHTKTTRDLLEQEFETIKKQGYAECVEEIEVGISSVAAPVSIDDMGAVYSVGAIGTIRRLTDGQRRKIGKRLVSLAEDLGSVIKVSGSL